MFENIMKFFKKITKKDKNTSLNSKDAAKERLHLVLMQDRANVSADFLELMKQEIIEVIKKYIDVDESAIDVRLTNKENEDGTNGAPALYANIPILNIKNETRKIDTKNTKDEKNETSENSKKTENKKTENKESVENKEQNQNKEEQKDSKDKELEEEEEKENADDSEENKDVEIIIDNNQKEQKEVEEKDSIK